MANPNALPPARDDLQQRIRKLEKQIKALQAANPMGFASDFADTDTANMTVAGSDITTGTLAVPGGFSSMYVDVRATVGNTRSDESNAPFYMQAWAEITEDPDSWWTRSSVIATTCIGLGSASMTASAAFYWTRIPEGYHIHYGAWAAVDDASGWNSGGANAHALVSVTFTR